METDTFLYFRISGNNLCLDEITQALNLPSPSVHWAGEFVKSKYGEKFDTTIKEDSWQVGCRIEEEQSFEDAVIQFLQQFLPHKDFIASLAKRYEIIFYVSLYPDEYHMSTHFSKRVLEMLNVLSVELCVTAMYV